MHLFHSSYNNVSIDNFASSKYQGSKGKKDLFGFSQSECLKLKIYLRGKLVMRIKLIINNYCDYLSIISQAKG